MSAIEPLCHLLGVSPTIFSKEEMSLLEAELFIRVCRELKEGFRQEYKEFFKLMKFTIAKEEVMLEENFIQLIINDILLTGEYTLSGIARYADISEDMVQAYMTGQSKRPAAICFRRVVELHRVVRRELYQAIGRKVVTQYMADCLRENQDQQK